MADTLPKMLAEIVREYPDHTAQLSKDSSGTFVPTNYRDFYRRVQECAAGLMQIGVTRGEHVGLISENRGEWLIFDLAVMSLGGADVPRGNDVTTQEVAYILGFGDCPTVAVENQTQLDKVLSVRDELPGLERLIVIDASVDTKAVKVRGVDVYSFAEILGMGVERLDKEPDCVDREMEQGSSDDTATIIFTSGTTGEPKGVMLSHRNYLYQVESIPTRIDAGPGDIWLSVLPVWHSFERIMQYVSVGRGSALAYSKPIGTVMLADFAAVKPMWMASVPRIWEAIRAGVYRNIKAQSAVKRGLFHFFVAVGSAHASLSTMMEGRVPQFRRKSRVVQILLAVLPYLLLWPLRLLGNALVFGKIKARLGGRFVAGISGGGALPGAVDEFFGAAGVLLLEGYGLTETAPVLAVREQHHPVPRTVGPMIPGTEVKIIDQESGEVLPPGKMGVVYSRGPQVMKGYYKRPEATAAVLSEDGWLNTGDLGMLTFKGELAITGRAKDTIVLLGGENVEPLPIEQKIQESEYVTQAVVVGQDQKYLGALIVVNMELLESYAAENEVPYMDHAGLLDSAEVQELISDEINSRVNAKNGFKSFERVFRFKLLPTEFEVGDELSAKQEIKRHVITEKYAKEIEEIFKS
jgi:long-chain acyl-CoA synthetase